MGVQNVIIEISQIYHWAMIGVLFGHQNIELIKRLGSCWTTFIAPFFNITFISWLTKLFSWGVIEISGGQDF